jgi:flagellar biosynthesis protein FliQ
VNEAYILTLVQNALMIVLILAGPILITSLSIGTLISLFQAATQINEITMTFIPKILGVLLVIVLLGSWMGEKMLAFTTDMFIGIASLPR